MRRATPRRPHRQSSAARPDRIALLTDCTKDTCRSSTPYPCFPSALPADCCYMFILFVVQGLPGSFWVLWLWSAGHELTHVPLHPSPTAEDSFHLSSFKKDALVFDHFFLSHHLRIRWHNYLLPCSTAKSYGLNRSQTLSPFSFMAQAPALCKHVS